ncbi:MAG: hypothetical protein A3C43_00605 [Candidatus Schekmanbacteria bacterium RIFCSPHIGHO2_02_FULL_38_11]|uniref:YtkA-like domain-containing protein n=1 Tax=Candidatus Schekmanbacteria bacterium RIFCSPLOWO2_12_FULL_38_15 TaxID=1817883 RepID=A0A1F7SQ31_9BACT|nr:MAG: hypothetical protein A2043_03765 [Candidatus Schekmanbacteria bacterium GWA2_38_9]OGL48415.1 MAG: hypothetical protein A3H37_05440 [Candidatus Schekmanbacteria bacterium RIFCSPLOWO2_02_FULL_38_14]OGL52009.1 MAG: hypothetical protein A3C43_00605 [Candidatus Schekmanbacteria bacterium RIFCSPHIGHO2_02_FULL_38_11]OGL55297.1 MAG: hypothetical protein A3G31_04640 [Candidatus Schekmanbacteria bacterium RIFCSPLOWO2_12_FULL_38_15]
MEEKMDKKKFLVLATMLLSMGLIGSCRHHAMAEEEHPAKHPSAHIHMMNANVVKADEYMVSYGIETMAAHNKMMQDMKVDASKMKMDPNASHHLSMEISEENGGKKIEDAKIKIKVIDPSEKSQEKWVEWSNEMKHYGCDMEMKEKGKYGVIILFKTNDDKKHTAKFWHEIK